MSYSMRIETRVLKAKLYINIMHEIWGKEESDNCRMTAEKKQY